MSGLAEDQDEALGHVLTGVIAGIFDHGSGPGVIDGEPLAGHSVEERTDCGAVEADACENQGDSLGEDGAETPSGVLNSALVTSGVRPPEPWTSLLDIAPTG